MHVAWSYHCFPMERTVAAFRDQEHAPLHGCFQAYERGIASFGFPHVREIWIAYLTKFVDRYKNKKLERARELYEQAIEHVPAKDAMVFYNMYAKLEEEHGLTRHAMR